MVGTLYKNKLKQKEDVMGQLVSDVTEILDYKDAKKQSKSLRQEILAQMASDEAEKINLIKKALATQRAKYGASGMSNSGITEGAVLKRIKSDVSTPYDKKYHENLGKLKKAQVNKPNLLKSLLSRFDNLMG